MGNWRICLMDKDNNYIGFCTTEVGVRNWVKKYGASCVQVIDNVADIVLKNGSYFQIIGNSQDELLAKLAAWRSLFGADLSIDGIEQTTEENLLMRTLYKPYKRRYSERREKPEIFEE